MSTRHDFRVQARAGKKDKITSVRPFARCYNDVPTPRAPRRVFPAGDAHPDARARLTRGFARTASVAGFARGVATDHPARDRRRHRAFGVVACDCTACRHDVVVSRGLRDRRGGVRRRPPRRCLRRAPRGVSSPRPRPRPSRGDRQRRTVSLVAVPRRGQPVSASAPAPVATGGLVPLDPPDRAPDDRSDEYDDASFEEESVEDEDPSPSPSPRAGPGPREAASHPSKSGSPSKSVPFAVAAAVAFAATTRPATRARFPGLAPAFHPRRGFPDGTRPSRRRFPMGTVPSRRRNRLRRTRRRRRREDREDRSLDDGIPTPTLDVRRDATRGQTQKPTKGTHARTSRRARRARQVHRREARRSRGSSIGK